MSLPKKFGAVIQRRREAMELSQQQLAEVAGIHRAYVKQLELGMRVPTIEVVHVLAIALKTTMTVLIAELEAP